MNISKYWIQAQELNWQHGLFRAWVVFSILWGAAFTIGGVASYVDDVKGALKPKTDGSGLFDDIPITNPPAASYAPSADTIGYFLAALMVPVLVFAGCKVFSRLCAWIGGGFKSKEVVKPDYAGASHKVLETAGLWAFRVFLYAFASVAIAGLISVVTVQTYKWLDIGLDGNAGLVSPFALFGVLLHFAAFKRIFFKDGKKGTAFLVYVCVFIVCMVLISAFAALLA